MAEGWLDTAAGDCPAVPDDAPGKIEVLDLWWPCHRSHDPAGHAPPRSRCGVPTEGHVDERPVFELTLGILSLCQSPQRGPKVSIEDDLHAILGGTSARKRESSTLEFKEAKPNPKEACADLAEAADPPAGGGARPSSWHSKSSYSPFEPDRALPP